MKLECFVSHHEVDVPGVAGVAVHPHGEASHQDVSHSCFLEGSRGRLGPVDVGLGDVPGQIVEAGGEEGSSVRSVGHRQDLSEARASSRGRMFSVAISQTWSRSILS